MLFHPFPGAFGLDIADLSIKVVQLRRVSKFLRRQDQNDLEATIVRSTQLPPGLIVNGELQEPEKVRRYLRHIIQGNSADMPAIRSPWVVASLPEPHGFIKLVEISKAPEDIIEDDIMYAATQHIPVPLDDLYVSWQIMSNVEAETSSVLIGTISKKIADMYTYLLESLGLGVVALESEAIATARAMYHHQPGLAGTAVAIVDLGAVRSSVTVCDNHILQFTTSLPYSGEMLTTALATQLGITHEEAEQKKQESGLVFSEKQLWHIFMNDASDNLAKYIQQAITFYYSHFQKTNRVSKIILCGGASQLKHLDDVLTTKLNMPVSIGNPWYTITGARGIIDTKKMTSEYETCVGLALRAIDNPFIKGDEI
jgi:type IV pilus assembly protein PilM